MRTLPSFVFCLVSAMAVGGASAASAQDAGFAPSPAVSVVIPPQQWDDGLRSPSLVSATLDPNASGFGPTTAVRATGPVAWVSRETFFEGSDGSVGRLSVTQGGPILGGVTGVPMWLDPSRAVVDDHAYDINYTRGWPGALKVDSGGYAVAVTPHAGIGTTNLGNSAELGASIRFGQADGLERLGVQDGAAFGQRGRWYLYAEASGRAVGYNFLRGENGWRRSGLSTDQGAFIGDQQAGVAWRKGPMQASFGYVQRSTQIKNIRLDNIDIDTRQSMVALTFSFKPR